MKLLRVTHAAMGHHGLLRRAVTGLARQVFRGVRFGAAFLSGVVKPGGFHGHQIGGFKLRPVAGQRVLNGLVLANGTAEDDAFAGVTGGAIQRGAPDSHGLGGDKNAFRVQAVDNGAESLALFPDAVFFRDFHVFEKHHVAVHGWRPILWISRTSTLVRSRSV